MFKGYRVTTVSTAKLGDDGFWVVDAKLSQERKEDGKDWESKEISSTARSVDLEEALGQTQLSMIAYLNTIGGDLFQEDVVKEEKELLN